MIWLKILWFNESKSQTIKSIFKFSIGIPLLWCLFILLTSSFSRKKSLLKIYTSQDFPANFKEPSFTYTLHASPTDIPIIFDSNDLLDVWYPKYRGCRLFLEKPILKNIY